MAQLIIERPDQKEYRINEALKMLRTNLEFSGEDIRVVALTSCTPSEGKSTVSLNLAASLAEEGKKVLYIDADLRKSVILTRIRAEQGTRIWGLSHFLTGKVKAEDVICETNLRGLQMIVAGVVVPNPAEILAGKHFKALLTAARKVYDYIIIDTPPLGSVIDGAIVANLCDGVAMVIETEVISHRFALEIKRQLEKANCHILGVILNKVRVDKKGLYGKYYGKGYGEYGQADAKK